MIYIFKIASTNMYGMLQEDLKQSMNKDGGAEADKSLQNLVQKHLYVRRNKKIGKVHLYDAKDINS
jgi:predicted transcriptional regulator